VSKIAPSRTNAEWLDELDKRNIPAMRVNSLESLLSDPHLEAVGFWQTVEHPSEGGCGCPAIPVSYRQDARRHPPAAAAARRAQRRDLARGRAGRRRDRRAVRLGRRARRALEAQRHLAALADRALGGEADGDGLARLLRRHERAAAR
jgi:hypothetical protein